MVDAANQSAAPERIPRFVRNLLLLGVTILLAAGSTALLDGTQATAARITTTRSAFASWVPTGPGTPNVSLQVTEVSGPADSSIFYLVNESYCITATNTAVFLSYSASGPQTKQIFLVTHSLRIAQLAAPHLLVNFTKKTAPECNTNGSDFTTVASGPRVVSLVGIWKATGPATPTFPGEVVRSASAQVIASAPKDLPLANLGPPRSAQISGYTPPR